jgi:hypothetical protein
VRRQQDYSIAPEFPRGDGTLTKWQHDDLEQVQLMLLLLLSASQSFVRFDFFASGTSLPLAPPILTLILYFLV